MPSSLGLILALSNSDPSLARESQTQEEPPLPGGSDGQVRWCTQTPSAREVGHPHAALHLTLQTHTPREMHAQCEGQKVWASKLSSPGDTVNLHWLESVPRAWLDLRTERQPTFITGGLPASAPVGPSQSPWSPQLCKTQSRTTGSTPALETVQGGAHSEPSSRPRAGPDISRHSKGRVLTTRGHPESPCQLYKPWVRVLALW